MDKKARIDTYNTIYDIDIVVANKNVKLDQLRKLFCYTDGEDLDDEAWGGWYFCTGIVKRRSDDATVVLIHNGSDKHEFASSGDELLDLTDVCAHEAVHAAMDVYNVVSAKIDTDNQECFAYFVGYIAERIMRTILNKK